MSIEQTLKDRADNKCELCGATNNLSVYEVPPVTEAHSDKAVLLCETCNNQIIGSADLTPNHWHCLNDSMWSSVPAVQVVAYRMLKKLDTESWAQDALDMLYLEDETKSWAEQALAQEDELVHLDSNGVRLQAGDTVVLIKDLDVKGANFTAKRGTAVRNISLSHSNPEHIEGRVEGQKIVILTKFVKK